VEVEVAGAVVVVLVVVVVVVLVVVPVVVGDGALSGGGVRSAGDVVMGVGPPVAGSSAGAAAWAKRLVWAATKMATENKVRFIEKIRGLASMGIMN
jgi:hypothetical protein